MATLKRATKKLPSEQNLRLLSSLILSISSKQTALEDRCIAPWKSGETYQANISYVSNLGYIWLCKTTNNDVDFSESKWIKLADDINEIDLDTIKTYLSLSDQQIETLAQIIKDDSIELSKTWSSSKSYTEIQNAIKESKEYCLKQLASKSTGSFKKANDVSEVTDGNYLYLIYNSGTSKYDIYALVDSNVELLTSVDVNLDDYFTKQEITDNYYDKSTSDGKFATITTVDTHIADTDVHVTKELKDKLVTTDDIATTIDSSSTDDTVAGALTTYNTIKRLMPYITSSVSSEDPDITTKALIRIRHDNAPTSDSEYFILTFFTDDTLEIVEKSQMAFNIGTNATYTRTKKYNSTWSGWTKILTNDNITTTIDSSSTNDTVPSAKAVETRVNKVNKCTVHSNEDLNLITEPGLYACVGGDTYGATHNFPVPDNGYLQHIVYPADGYSMQTFVPNGVWGGQLNMYVRRQVGSVWSSWQRLCGTTVADVGITNITSFSSNYTSGTVSYMIKNGMCHVSVIGLKLTSTGYNVPICGGMPTPALGFVDVLAEDGGNLAGNIMISGDGKLTSHYHDATKNLHCTFSYPVA